MSQYSYSIEVLHAGRWYALHGTVSLSEGHGYLWAVEDGPTPRLAHRLVRSDGRVIRELSAIDQAVIGVVAGWPTWEQYAVGAMSALDCAAVARGRTPAPAERLRGLADAVRALLAEVP